MVRLELSVYLVTGGAGFIGSKLVEVLLARGDNIVVLDALTYSGRRENLAAAFINPNLVFVEGSVCDPDIVSGLLSEHRPNAVINVAAETHVDRSIQSAGSFVTTDVYGTFVLLDAARTSSRLQKFVQISTDEVYGSVMEGSSTESDQLLPRNPYAATKAGADRLAYSYWSTYNVPVIITRASNNYGPRQFPEKIIPLLNNMNNDLGFLKTKDNAFKNPPVELLSFIKLLLFSEFTNESNLSI